MNSWRVEWLQKHQSLGWINFASREVLPTPGCKEMLFNVIPGLRVFKFSVSGLLFLIMALWVGRGAVKHSRLAWRCRLWQELKKCGCVAGIVQWMALQKTISSLHDMGFVYCISQYFAFLAPWLKGEEMGSSHARFEPDVPEEISECPKLHRPDWSSRRLEVECFGVVRHASRADTIGATWNGTLENFQQAFILQYFTWFNLEVSYSKLRRNHWCNNLHLHNIIYIYII